MEETAAGADHEGKVSEVGSGDIFLWSALYASAEVEEVVCCFRDGVLGQDARAWMWLCLGVSRGGREQRARRAAIVAWRGSEEQD